jgi:hypothetical protein
MSTSIINFRSSLQSALSGDDDASVSEIRAYFEFLAEQEQAIFDWGNALKEYIDKRVATCSMIRKYDRAVLMFLRTQMRTAFLMKSAGLDVPPPVFPTLFGSKVCFKQLAKGDFLFAITIPGCGPRGDERPRYDLFRVVKPEDCPPGIEIPPDSLRGELGALGCEVVCWGLIALGVIVVGGVAVTAISNKFFRTEEQIVRALEAQENRDIAAKGIECMHAELERPGNKKTASQALLDCGAALSLFPRNTKPADPISTALKVGAVVGGAVIGYKYAKGKGWI